MKEYTPEQAGVPSDQTQAQAALEKLSKTNPQAAEILRRNMAHPRGLTDEGNAVPEVEHSIPPAILADAKRHEERHKVRTDD